MLQRNLSRFLLSKVAIHNNFFVSKAALTCLNKSTKTLCKTSLFEPIFMPCKFNRISTFQGVASEFEDDPDRVLISNPSEIKTKKVMDEVNIKPTMTLGEFRKALPISQEEFEESIQSMGIPDDPDFVLGLNEMELIAYENNIKPVTKQIPKEDTPLRPPIITIMGHVDHGKTTLLDAFRDSNIAEGEYGGITQKIGAFMIKTKEGRGITFIDTPGHEAFVNMRKRGSLCTDMVILVVSATDGCQPQTFEAIQHAKNAGVPIIVAVNKIDKGGNPEEVEKELYHYGLNLESHGGNVPVIHISAKFKKNIDLLEELILFEAELMDLRAEADCPGEGVILETKRNLDNETKACTVIVQKGTLKIGDVVIVGTQHGKIKQIKDDRGNLLNQAVPASAVEITGLKELPENGEALITVPSIEKARLIVARRIKKKENEEQIRIQSSLLKGQKVKFNTSRERRKFHSGSKEIVQGVLEGVETKMLEKIKELQADESDKHKDEIQKLQEELLAHQTYVEEMINLQSNDTILNLILKAQDKGTLETLVDQINKIAAKQDLMTFNILNTSVGNVTEADVRDAKNFRAVIFGMDITCSPDLTQLAQAEKVQVKTYKIIYDILDELKGIFKRGGMFKPEITVHGAGVIKQVFEVKLGKGAVRKVAGTLVNQGQLTRKYKYRVMRDGKVVLDNLDVSSLKHHKEEVNEIKKGKECGISLFGFDEYKAGDIIEAYEIAKQTAK